MTGWRNCRTCGAWRPVHDYPPRQWAGGRILYTQTQCRACHRAAARARYRALPKPAKRVLWERSREAHAAARRAAGVPVHPNWRPSTRAVVQAAREQLLADPDRKEHCG